MGYVSGGAAPYSYSAGYSGSAVPMPAVDTTEQGTIDRGSRGAERGDRGTTNPREGSSSDRENRGKGSNEKPEARGPAPATLIVTLPADAHLTVDGNATRSTSSVRTFISPPLTPDRDYRYTLKADFQRDGKPVTVSKAVTVRAGQETRVNLASAPNEVASK
jgi:uncharacterized protein (TIGR03000 family)